MRNSNEFREYKPKDIFESELIDTGTPHDLVEFILKLQLGEKITRTFYVPKNVNDTSRMQRFIDSLREGGVDIGKGDSQYGFKMPLPDPKDPNYHPNTRSLVVFRRR